MGARNGFEFVVPPNEHLLQGLGFRGLGFKAYIYQANVHRDIIYTPNTHPKILPHVLGRIIDVP